MDSLTATKSEIDPKILSGLEELAILGKVWGPGVMITQKMVDMYTGAELFKDPNPIHKADYPGGPIVPGLMLTSMLSRLSPLSQQTEIGGYTIINKGLGPTDFKRPVPVGRMVTLRYTPGEPSKTKLGVLLPFNYEIAAHPELKVAVVGSIVLLLPQH